MNLLKHLKQPSGIRLAPLVVLAGLSVLCVAQHAWYWPRLPLNIATHFGANGVPDAWMSRTAGTAMMCGFQLGLPLFLLTVGGLAGKLPDHMLNMPHREYWLHPERREATLAWTGQMLAWVAVLSSAFLAVLAHLTFLANIAGGSLNTTVFFTALALYLTAVFVIAGRSLWHFRLPRETARLD